MPVSADSSDPAGATADPRLAGIEAHPHARAVLLPALPPYGSPSHAYLFHGPAGAGKRAIARAFAAELLCGGSADREGVIRRVNAGTHPDLTWVTPSGAREMLVVDIEEPVVAAATRTPFEASRRVFVIEAADAMNDEAANRMLKTLEEPAPYAHLVLLTDRRADVMATIASRCQQVRFDALSPEAIAAGLDAEPDVAMACARLSLGDASLAATLAGHEGAELRAAAQRFVRSAIAGETAGRPWAAIVDLARAAGARSAAEAKDAMELELSMIPSREQSRFKRESEEAGKRGERRARTEALDLALRISELWIRDMICIGEGAPELIHALDAAQELLHDAEGADADVLREALAAVCDTRLSLQVNVSDELALEALAYRLQALLAG